MAETQTAGYIVAFEQNSAGSPNQSFSITPTLHISQGRPLDIADTNGYAGSDCPPDDKPHRTPGGCRARTTIVESISWQVLYATSLVVGYRLIVTTREDSLSHSYAWLPIGVNVVVGWLLKSYWNPDSSLFKQIDQQEASLERQLAIITMPGDQQAQQHQPSGSSGQQASGTTSYCANFSLYVYVGIGWNSGNGDGGGDGGGGPQQHVHTLGSNCFVHPCNGWCTKSSHHAAIQPSTHHTHHETRSPYHPPEPYSEPPYASVQNPCLDQTTTDSDHQYLGCTGYPSSNGAATQPQRSQFHGYYQSTTPPQGAGYEVSSVNSSPQAAGDMTRRDLSMQRQCMFSQSHPMDSCTGFSTGNACPPNADETTPEDIDLTDDQFQVMRCLFSHSDSLSQTDTTQAPNNRISQTDTFEFVGASSAGYLPPGGATHCQQNDFGSAMPTLQAQNPSQHTDTCRSAACMEPPGSLTCGPPPTNILCDLTSDGSIVCSVNDQQQTAEAFLANAFGTALTLATKADTTTNHADNAPPAKRKKSNSASQLECPRQGCDKKYARLWQPPQHQKLPQHQKRAHPTNNQLTYSCPSCYKIYALRGQLTQHQKLSHPTDDQLTHTCPSCGNKYALQWLLTQHQKLTHPTDDQLIYVCPHQGCNRKFAYLSQLTRHQGLAHHP